MSTKISITDFRFEFKGYGHYRVTYQSPKTYKTWSMTTTNMPLIDNTKNAECPKQKDLQMLKYLCKDANKEYYSYKR